MDDWTYTVEWAADTIETYEVRDWQTVPVPVDAFGQGADGRSEQVKTIIAYTGWSPGINSEGNYTFDFGAVICELRQRVNIGWSDWAVSTFIPHGTGTYRWLSFNTFNDMEDAATFVGLFR